MSYEPATPVLVAVMKSLEDWERVQHEHWYRIPLQHAPKRISASILAWYHTRVFEEARWQVRWYAPIERAHILKRSEILPDEFEHPRADERYWKLELGPLCALPQPIPARQLRRITFIPTRWEQLLHAADVNQLWIGDRATSELCQQLIEAGYNIAERKLRERLHISEQPQLHIQALLDIVQVSWPGGALRFSYYDIIWNPKECIERILYYERMQRH